MLGICAVTGLPVITGGAACAAGIRAASNAPTSALNKVLARASERTNMAYLPGLIDSSVRARRPHRRADRGWQVSNQPRSGSSNARKYQPVTGHRRDENC